MSLTIICQRVLLGLKDHFWPRLPALALMALLAASCPGCVHIYENTGFRLAGLAASGHLPPPAREEAPAWLLAWPLSAALALAYAGRRLRRARRAAAVRLEKGRPLDRQDLALARTARDALTFLARRQASRWRVALLDEFRRRRGS